MKTSGSARLALQSQLAILRFTYLILILFPSLLQSHSVVSRSLLDGPCALLHCAAFSRRGPESAELLLDPRFWIKAEDEVVRGGRAAAAEAQGEVQVRRTGVPRFGTNQGQQQQSMLWSFSQC